MADKKTYWMASASGEKARVTGADQRDLWIPRGWSESDEPTDTDFVWMEHESDDITEPAKIPWGARGYFEGVGFSPSAPPEPVDLTRDPHLRDQAKKPAPAATKSSAATTTAATDKKQEG